MPSKPNRQITYALDRPKATKLALEVLFVSTVVEARDDEGLECVSTNVGILMWVICISCQ